LHLVLDSNEYVFVFGADPKTICIDLLEYIASHSKDYLLRICRPILDEIGRHLLPQHISEVYAYLNALDISVDERWSVPFEFVERYIEKGLKRGDAFIAGYAEWIGADCLISENRADIVSHAELFPFKVYTAEQFLKKHL
jgi:hypothetical protein